MSDLTPLIHKFEQDLHGLIDNKNIDENNIYMIFRFIFELYKTKGNSISLSKETFAKMSMICYNKGDLELFYETSIIAYKFIDWPEISLRQLRMNQSFYIEKFYKRFVDNYQIKDITNILETNRKKSLLEKLITVTVTSCKRLDLFKSTVSSFLNCCQDLELIYEWIVIDDNSSDSERTQMKNLFPFIKFIWKSYEEKGHAKSMNILRNEVKTPFIFHMEDDWIFFRKEKYLSICLDILSEDNSFGQCLVNREYGERNQCHDIFGTDCHITSNNNRYYIHHYLKDKELHEFNMKNKVKNAVYWPHYSLRPGIMRTSVWKELGEYDISATHFELDYANKYVNANYKTVFMDNLYCWHSGRCTFERDDTSKINAYTLNNEDQFVKSNKKDEIKEEQDKEEKLNRKIKLTLTKEELELPEQIDGIKEYDNKYKIDTYVINLKKRPNRLKKFIINNHDQLSVLKYKVFEGIDGSLIKPTPKILKIFETGDYNYRTGIIGCALSHMQLMISLLTSDNLDCYLIFEDDVTLPEGFMDKLIVAIKRLPSDWDVVFLGHFLYDQFKSDKDRCNDLPIVKKWTKEDSIKKSIGGMFGYLINKSGANKTLSHIKEKGMYNAVDWVIFKNSDCNIYYSYPHLVYSECVGPNSRPESDIQYNNQSLCSSIEEKYKHNILFFVNALKQKGVRYYDRNNHVDKSDIKMWPSIIGIEEDIESKIIISSVLPNRDIVLGNVCFIMEGDIEFIKTKIECLPLSFYVVDKCIVLIPLTKMNDEIRDNIIFDNSYLDSNKPVKFQLN